MWSRQIFYVDRSPSGVMPIRCVESWDMLAAATSHLLGVADLMGRGRMHHRGRGGAYLPCRAARLGHASSDRRCRSHWQQAEKTRS